VKISRLSSCKNFVREKFTGLPWVWGFPWVWVWDGYGDYDESPWVCGDSMGIFEWIPNYVEMSKYSAFFCNLIYWNFPSL